MTDYGPDRPIPITPVAGGVTFEVVRLVDAEGQTVRAVRVEILTAAGSAYAFFAPDTLEPILQRAISLCGQARTGLVTPTNGQIIRPPGS